MRSGVWKKWGVVAAAAVLAAGCAADGEFRTAGDPNGPASRVGLAQGLEEGLEEVASLESEPGEAASQIPEAGAAALPDAEPGAGPVRVVGSAVFLPFPQSAFKPALMEQVASDLGARSVNLQATGNGDGLSAICGGQAAVPQAELALTTREASAAEAAACVDRGRTLQVEKLAAHTGALGPRVTGVYVAYDAEALRPEALAVLEHLRANKKRFLSSPAYAAFFELVDGGA